MMENDSVLRPVIIILAVLFAVPLFMMGIVMPVAMLTVGSGMMATGGGFALLFPLIPITILGVIVYALLRLASAERYSMAPVTHGGHDES